MPDGPPVVERWHNLGRAQAERLGVEAVILDVNDRRDANDATIAALVEGAGLIYLSGGHPAFLAETLRGTLVWDAIVAAWRSGAALAGCSAGAMAFSSWVPSLATPARVAPKDSDYCRTCASSRTSTPSSHASLTWSRDSSCPTTRRSRCLGIDEETAIVGGPSYWTVKGRSSAWRLSDEGREQFASGTSLTTPLK